MGIRDLDRILVAQEPNPLGKLVASGLENLGHILGGNAELEVSKTSRFTPRYSK